MKEHMNEFWGVSYEGNGTLVDRFASSISRHGNDR